jgi:mono/diheme cytochrome c family protein
MFRRMPLLLGAALGLGALAACYVGPIERNHGAKSNPTDRAGASSTESGDPSTGGAPSGLPCDVDALLAQRCRSCHVAGGSAPMPLTSYDDLVAPSKSDPAKSNAVLSIERLRSSTRPMPPAPLERAPSEEIVVLETWVASGLPRGECGAAEGEDGEGTTPTNVPSICTSNQFWSSNRRGPTMQPGRACITCHESQEDKPVVWVGGTVYPTLREPDGCYGIAGDATVVITDAAGRVVSLPVGPTGNFSLSAESSAPLTMPIRAKVVRNGKERAMATPQSSGNCNACHTENGANGAPGRILTP